MAIAKFPNFSKLSLSDKEEIQTITSRFEPYSDFNFTSLFCWNTASDTEVSILNDNLTIKLPDYLSGEPVYSILGDSKIDLSMEELFVIASNLKLVPEVTVKALKNDSKYKITEDEDNFDYIYELEKLANLSGAELKKKRNKANRFMNSFKDEVAVENIMLISKAHAKHIENVFLHWARAASKSPEETEAERKALMILLDNSESFPLVVTVIMTKSTIKAFSINEKLDDQYAISHFEKALKIHEDIYPFLTTQVAGFLKDMGCRYVNWEQDLGIAGLHQSKQSYQPYKMLKKYTLSVKE